MASRVKNLGEVEYDNYNSLQQLKIQVGRQRLKWGVPPITTVHKSVHNKKVSN